MAYEDFTTYTEVDPNNRFSVATNVITITELTRTEDAYIYKDQSAGHFSGDFEHLFKFVFTAGANDTPVFLVGLSNTINDNYEILNTSNDYIGVRYYRS